MEKLGNFISAFIKGKTPKVLYSEKAEGLHPYVSPDYLRGKGNPEFFAAMTNKTIPLEDDEIIILWDGSNAGEVLLSKKGILASTMVKLLVDETKLDKKYFAYSCLNLEYILKAKTAGSGIPHADKGVIKNLPFYFPTDKAEQTAIAKILSTVDEAIRSTRETISKLERVKKSLMQNLLSGKMKPDGTLRPATEFYKDDNMGLVPKGWKSVKLKEVADIQRGKFGHRPRNDERFYNGQYPFVQTSDVVNSIFYLKGASQSLNDLGKSVSRSFPKGTIIMTIAANIGFVAITEYEVFFPDSLIGINANEDIIDADYLMLNLMGYKNILDAQATESAQKNINYSNLRPLLIMFPTDKDEQKSIVQSIKNIYKQIDNKQEKITALELLKKSLMQQLLTGRVRVK